MPPANEIEIVDYSADHGEAFERLNREWLDRYFRVEPVDVRILAAPEASILADGGAILYALLDGEAVGTVALKHCGDGLFELTKMAVTEASQGLGLGRRLLSAAVDRFEACRGKKLYLESHSSLKAALSLYESAGFRHEARAEPSDYERADVYMVYRPD